MKNFKDFLGIKAASRMLGVNDDTLRLWCENGRMKHKRHPINGYYLFLKEDIDDIIKSLQDDLK